MAANSDWSMEDLVAIQRRDALNRGKPWPPAPPFDPSSALYRYNPRPQPEIATIYFLGPKDGPIKIGWASRLEYRLKDLRLANAFPLEVWASVEGPVKLERDYHKRFKAHRLHGEWFDRHPDILAEIERLNSLPPSPLNRRDGLTPPPEQKG